MKQAIKTIKNNQKRALNRTQRSVAYGMCKRIVSRPDLIYAMIQANEEKKNVIRDNLQAILVNAISSEIRSRKYVSDISIDLKTHKNEYEYIQRVILAD